MENEFAETWLDHRELDCLIYNALPGCADLVLNGDVKKYLDTVISIKNKTIIRDPSWKE